MRKSKLESVGVVYRLISNLWVEKMNDTLAPLMEIINRVGYKSGQAGLLTYLDYVI